MSKHKKKSFWGENVSDQSQIGGMTELLRLTRAVESGGPIPNIDFTEDSSGFDEEVDFGVMDAITRLTAKNNSGEMPDGFNPLQRIEYDADVPEVEAIHGEADSADAPVIREMEAIDPEPIPVSQDYPARMLPPSTVTAEDVIPDDDENFAYDEKPLEFSDFRVVYTNFTDDWLHVYNPYDIDHHVSFSTFNLRGYNVEKDAAYDTMLKYIPIMISLIAGPALIVKQDDPVFKKFMRSSVDRGIQVDKTKFMIFTVENTSDKMFMIYLMDTPSRKGIFEGLIPPMVERSEEADFFVQLAGLVLHPMINPYGMTETMWPADRASEELDSPAKVEEFCNIMMKELGIEPVESSKTSYTSSLMTFKKKSVIGDIQKFLKTVEIARDEFMKQLNPDNYVEKFLEERYPEETDEESGVENEDVATQEVDGSDTTGTDSIADTADKKVAPGEPEDLFDGVGESIPTDDSTGVSASADSSEDESVEATPKHQKAGADGKKVNKKFEIPVQR